MAKSDSNFDTHPVFHLQVLLRRVAPSESRFTELVEKVVHLETHTHRTSSANVFERRPRADLSGFREGGHRAKLLFSTVRTIKTDSFSVGSG